MKHLAFCNGDLVAVVARNKRGQWEISWPRRNYARERIANLEAAKSWVANVLHGKLVTWLATKGSESI